MQQNDPGWKTKLHIILPQLGEQESRVADYFLGESSVFMQETIQTIAEKTGTSKSTIVRFCNKLGYSGLKEFKIQYASSLLGSTVPVQDVTIQWGDSYDQIKQKVFTGCMESIQETAALLNQQEMERVASMFLNAKNIYVYAYGGSSPNAMYLIHKLMELGCKCQLFSNTQAARLSFSQLQKDDVVFAISCGGYTETVVEAVSWAHSNHISTICLTNGKDSPLAKESDVVLYNSGGVFQEGDFNTYSRTAQLTTIDLLFAMLVQRIGKDAFTKITNIHYKHRKKGIR